MLSLTVKLFIIGGWSPPPDHYSSKAGQGLNLDITLDSPLGWNRAPVTSEKPDGASRKAFVELMLLALLANTSK